jgi:hypothetical protein
VNFPGDFLIIELMIHSLFTEEAGKGIRAKQNGLLKNSIP